MTNQLKRPDSTFRPNAAGNGEKAPCATPFIRIDLVQTADHL